MLNVRREKRIRASQSKRNGGRRDRVGENTELENTGINTRWINEESQGVRESRRGQQHEREEILAVKTWIQGVGKRLKDS